MAFCTARTEGFSTHSTLSTPLPTSCFIDMILVPLPTWVYLLALLVLYAAHRNSYHLDLYATHDHKAARHLCHNVGAVLYYILGIVAVLMVTLEIVRLALAGLGIGLLPFTYVAILVALGMRWTDGLRGRVKGWRAAGVALWVGLVAMSAVKVAGEVKEGIGARAGSKYPMLDQVTDVGTMIGLFLVLGVLEVVVRK
jgi:hypothetical protein